MIKTNQVTTTYPLNTLSNYKYAVIFAKYQNKWLYPRHKERTTFETAGGHIEKGETPLEAAKREFYEETGATKFQIRALFDYLVEPSGYPPSSGQVFYAEVQELSQIPESEMAEVQFFETLPNCLTYPLITPILFDKVVELTK